MKRKLNLISCFALLITIFIPWLQIIMKKQVTQCLLVK